MATGVKKFPVLNDIDERLNCDNLDWNKNAFETLLVRSSLTRDDTEVCFFLLARHPIFRQQPSSIMLWTSVCSAWKIVSTRTIGTSLLML